MEKIRTPGDVHCCLEICRNTLRNTTNVQFFYLPSNFRKEQREKWIDWIKGINSKGWQPMQCTRICSEHFVGNDWSCDPARSDFAPSIRSLDEADRRLSEAPQTQRNKRSSSPKTLPAIGPPKIGRNEIDAPSFNTNSRKDISNDRKLMIDQTIQVSIIEPIYQSHFHHVGKVFVCDRLVSNDVCHVQIQTFIPEKREIPYPEKKRFTREKACGENASFPDRKCTRDFSIWDSTDFLETLPILNYQTCLNFCNTKTSKFQLLHEILPPRNGKIKRARQLMIFLMKFKIGITFTSLGILMGMNKHSVARHFFHVLKQLRQACDNLISWPSRDALQKTMPDVIKQLHPDCRVIISSVDFIVHQSWFLANSSYSDSKCKGSSGAKALIGFTPCGAVSFVSKCFPEGTSDCEIIENSGILNLIEPGDLIIADKDYPGIERALGRGNKFLAVGSSSTETGKPSLGNAKNEEKMAVWKIHAEKITRELRNYNILHRFIQELLPHADDVIFMCGVLVNLRIRTMENSDSREFTGCQG